MKPASFPLHPSGPQPPEINPVVVLVVGAHPRAEMHDRPIASDLGECVGARVGAEKVLICTDLWYLNDDSLRAQPTISIGEPRVNALTAFLADKIPSVLAVDDAMIVQLDLELAELVACCWGVDAERTRAACDAFRDRYLEAYIEAATRRHGA